MDPELLMQSEMSQSQRDRWGPTCTRSLGQSGSLTRRWGETQARVGPGTRQGGSETPGTCGIKWRSEAPRAFPLCLSLPSLRARVGSSVNVVSLNPPLCAEKYHEAATTAGRPGKPGTGVSCQGRVAWARGIPSPNPGQYTQPCTDGGWL